MAVIVPNHVSDGVVLCHLDKFRKDVLSLSSGVPRRYHEFGLM